MSDEFDTFFDESLGIAARGLSLNRDFIKLFKEDLFTTRKNELVNELSNPYNLIEPAIKERIIIELSHIAYIESYINNLIEDTNL